MELLKATAVVTGAARGIGKAIAASLASEGVQIAIVDILEAELRTTVDEFSALGFSVCGYRADITDAEDVRRATDSILADLGSVDILVNNAGTFSVIGSVWEVDTEKWFRDIRVNLYGTFLMCNALIGQMAKRNAGYVINMASAGGVSDPHAHMTSYATSKTALVRLTEGLAKELEGSNVKVFAIGPPAILTDMTKFIMNDEGGQRWRPKFREIFEKGQDAKPELICDLIKRLLRGEADALTGRFIPGTVDLDWVLSQLDEIMREDLYLLRIRQPGTH